MGDSKEALEYIEALENFRDWLRDWCHKAIKDADDWKAAYQEAMKPPRWLE